MATKKKVMFIGSFASSGKSGNVGGQMYACKSLIESDLSNKVSWILVDSTAVSNMKINFYLRLFNAFLRIVKSTYFIITNKLHAVLIFTADGASFVEKGTIALIAKTFGVRVLFAPRSGYIQYDLDKHTFLSRFMKLVFKKVDVIICQSEFWLKIFIERGEAKSEKCRIIPNWIDTSSYRTKITYSNIPSLLFLGWVDKEKGIFELIKAVKHLKEKHLFHLSIAGKGVAFEEANKLIQDLSLNEVITMKGWIVGEDKISLLESSDIFVLPSYAEGLPNALLEAMASGLACISTDVGSIPELIKDNFNGLVIKSRNVEELIFAIDDLLTNKFKIQRFGINARNSILRNHNINNAVDQFKELLHI